MTYIVDQDRENVYPRPENLRMFYPGMIFINDILCGVNLMFSNTTVNNIRMSVNLGTFDDLEDVNEEIQKISNFKGKPGDTYLISGYFDDEELM